MSEISFLERSVQRFWDNSKLAKAMMLMRNYRNKDSLLRSAVRLGRELALELNFCEDNYSARSF